MRFNEVRESLRVHPFEPFRIHLSNGMVFEVRHPEMALITPHSVHVVELATSGRPTDKVVKCDLARVVALEPVNGRGSRRRRRTK